MSFTEAQYENAVIELFRDVLGYRHVYAPDLARDYTEPLYMDELLYAIRQVNPRLPVAATDEAVKKLRNIESGTSVQRNRQFMDYLQNGIEVNYFDEGVHKTALVKLIDYEHTDRNSFVVANQWTIVELSEKRPDIIVFVNGLPLVVFELKSPSREETEANEGYKQLRNYLREHPILQI